MIHEYKVQVNKLLSLLFWFNWLWRTSLNWI